MDIILYGEQMTKNSKNNDLSNIPRTESIKYIGSKLKMLPYILRTISSLNDINTVLDAFSGTTRVSQALSQLGYDTDCNDISVLSECLGKCYLLANNDYNYYNEIITHLNNLKPEYGWFSENYGGNENDQKKPFQFKNTMKLDAIRNEIDILNLSENDRCVIITSLLLALDKVDSTIGHFSSYLKSWSKRSYLDLYLEVPNKFEIKTKNNVFKEDVFSVVKKHHDLVYFDPPYGSNNEKMPASRVRYDAYYHFWKTVILNDKPELFGKVNRRIDSRDNVNPSVFESFRKNTENEYEALEAIKKLVDETNSHYILLSYNSNGRATEKELISMLNNTGQLLNIFSIDYKKNVMSNMCWTNDWKSENNKNKEFLFLLER